MNNVKSADFLDILFENRNKSYGAYDLRRTYAKRLASGLLVALAATLLFFVFVRFVNFTKKELPLPTIEDSLVLDIKEMPVPLKPPPPLDPPPPSTTPPVKENRPKQISFNIIEIKTTVSNPPGVIPPDTQVGLITDTTGSEGNSSLPEPTGPGTDIQLTQPAPPPPPPPPPTPASNDNEPVDVDIEAEYPGGFTAWMRYLQRKLDAEVGARNGAPPGRYTVKVRFIVGKDGSVSDVVAITKHGYGLEQEAVSVIKLSGAWNPGSLNGKPRTSYRTQPITFDIQEGQ